ncbi:helix-turn-helix transcriptional regulator [Cysteiniphilum marinum]|uniref:helix-turn-helix transcriptional regulator n=1 Tax=Cysteiniphilum marinum TaxID=2774191 RepID=UPI00193BE0E1|nr:hypothetical protein [Cysteiniphilum marinum]
MKILSQNMIYSVIINKRNKVLLLDDYSTMSLIPQEQYYGKDSSAMDFKNIFMGHKYLNKVDLLIILGRLYEVQINGIVVTKNNDGVELSYYSETKRTVILDLNKEILGIRVSSNTSPSKPSIPVNLSGPKLQAYAQQYKLSLAELKVLFFRLYFPQMTIKEIALMASLSINSVYRYSGAIKEKLSIASYHCSYSLVRLRELGVFSIFAQEATSYYLPSSDYQNLKKLSNHELEFF